MKKVGFIADSSLELKLNEEKIEDIYIMRQRVIIENKEYVDQIDLHSEDIFKAQRENFNMSTSAPLLGESIALIEQCLEQYEQLIIFPISSYLSKFHENLVQMVSSMPYAHRVFIVDTHHISYGLLSLIRDAKKLLEQGIEIQTLVEKLEQESEQEAFLIPANMTYLAKGGRVNNLVASLGNLLKIIPIISFGSKPMYVLEKVRTNKKAYKVACEHLLSNLENINDYRFAIIYGDNSQKDKIMDYEEFRSQLPSEIEIVSREFGATLLCHTGADSIAFVRVKKML